MLINSNRFFWKPRNWKYQNAMLSKCWQF